jgi:hypothetical protein
MKSIAKVWTFKSSSSDKTYQPLLYTDFSTSCDCPGWTRRTDSQGKRTCRHTRSVEMGNADSEAINFHSYEAPTKAMLHTGEIVSIKPEKHTQLPLYGRKLCI